MFQILGYLGLLPMAGPLFFFNNPFWVNFFVTYSLAILSFVSGTLWSRSFQLLRSEKDQIKILLISNACVLIAFFSVLYLNRFVLLVLASIFALVLLVERYFFDVEDLAEGYFKMRSTVSTIVIFLHIMGFVFLRAA
ncbi:MAG: hypothetical protein CMQ39_06175 [Gammaproteobacteria bacterium]|nr:hypothetical protein [Gammaproteobacteria bacterium]